MANYTAGHESRAQRLDRRLDYPEDHVEVDNRLAWFLGSLDRIYGDDPVYVHLTRDPEWVAESYSHRFYVNAGVMHAYAVGIIRNTARPAPKRFRQIARAYVETVTDNVELFLRDKTKVVRMRIEEPHDAFDRLWDLLGAKGDREAAHATLGRVHNARRRKGRKGAR